MNMYRYPRPAIFLPGDSRRAPAYARRDASRLERRRTSDPYAPAFARSSWRRSDACQQSWRIGPRTWGYPVLGLYSAVTAISSCMVRTLGAVVSMVWRAIERTRANVLQMAFLG